MYIPIYLYTNSYFYFYIHTSSRLLHDSSIIDQTYITRQALSLTLARQWFGVHIIQKTWMDTWLIVGLANLMGSLFIKRHLGNNEYRLRLKKVKH